MLRRGLALGAGLLVLILIVLGVKGCLDARADRELTDYARNVTEIVEETSRTSKAFFGKLEDSGELSENEFIEAVKADRSAMDNYASRVDALSTPGDMANAQDTLKLVYELRSSAMNVIANQIDDAFGDAGPEKAVATIAAQMQKLMASDVLYETIVRPEIDAVLADKGIEGSDVPKSTFVPGGTTWLEESAISDALAVSGGAATPGIHGLGLGKTSINGIELVEGVSATISAAEGVEVEVQVQNQGDSEESGVTVSVHYEGTTLSDKISMIAPSEFETVTIPLTPTPKGTVTLDVKVDPVPGEQLSENNEASFTVSFE